MGSVGGSESNSHFVSVGVVTSGHLNAEGHLRICRLRKRHATLGCCDPFLSITGPEVPQVAKQVEDAVSEIEQPAPDRDHAEDEPQDREREPEERGNVVEGDCRHGHDYRTGEDVGGPS